MGYFCPGVISAEHPLMKQCIAENDSLFHCVTIKTIIVLPLWKSDNYFFI